MRDLFKLILVIPALLGSTLTPMILMFPNQGWIDEARWIAVGFALFAGAHLCVSILMPWKKEGLEP